MASALDPHSWGERGYVRALPKGPELRVQPDANLGLQDLPSTVLFLHSFSLSLAEAKNLGEKSPRPQVLHTARASASLTFTKSCRQHLDISFKFIHFLLSSLLNLCYLDTRATQS